MSTSCFWSSGKLVSRISFYFRTHCYASLPYQYLIALVKFSSNISKTSASVSSGVPNTEKVMKARGRRPSALIVSRCLEPLMKHEARAFDMASQMKQ